MTRVTVVGAGVIGLSCAVRLLDAGHRVDVVARDLPLETTSVTAAALWFTYLAEPRDLVERWAGLTRRAFEAIAEDEPEGDHGVRLLPGTIVGPAGPDQQVAPVVDMPAYLRWLTGRLVTGGGTLTRLNVATLPATDGVVVNCTGLGARHLADDRTVTPVAGQVVVVEQFGLERWWLDPAAPTYVVPRRDEVVVGGTSDAGEWSRTPSPETADHILARATLLVPAVAEARVLRHKVGLRPARPAVRLERVGDVVHCYGHGGSGVTLSWGCADDVVSLVGRASGAS